MDVPFLNDSAIDNVTTTSRFSSSSNGICDRLVGTLRMRTRISMLQCSSLKSPRACCSALDTNGQPCMPIRTGDQRSCVSIDWVISHLPNVTLIECSKIPLLSL